MKSEDLKKAVQNISLTLEDQDRIRERVFCPARVKEESKMLSKKRTGLLILAATLLLGVTVFAASGVITSWYASSTSRPEYSKLPSKEQCRKDIGYEPVLIKEFNNGYVFKEGTVIDNRLENEDGKTAEKFKSVCFKYEKAGDELMFSEERYKSKTPEPGRQAAQIDGKKLFYYSYKNKFVPANYQKTKEDKEAEKKGDLVFSYGTDQVEIITVQSISWKDKDMHFELMQMDGKLSESQLVEIAKEVIRR